MVAVCCVVIIGGRHYGLTSWVESKVSLIHQLLIERLVYCSVASTSTSGGVRMVTLDMSSFSIFEKFRENRFLLVVVQIHAFTLNSTTTNSINSSLLNLLELVFAALTLVVVTRRMPGFHTLRILSCFWQSQ